MNTYIVGADVEFQHPDHELVMMAYQMLQGMQRRNRKITMIKLIRYLLNIGLKESKGFVEDAWASSSRTPNP